MTRTLFRVTTLLAAVAILLCGHGLQLSLLPLHAVALGWSANEIGLTGSAYFLGFVIGCMTIPRIVGRVGHIRTFMVMGAIATLALLWAGVIGFLYPWLLFRFATGFAFSGLYMVIESWLSDLAPPDSRASVLAVYTVICLLGMMAGQGLLAFGAAQSLQLFVVGAGFLCLAIIPIGLTRITAPHPIPRTRFSFGVLLKASRVAVVCALLGGLITGAIWATGPLVGQAFGLDAGGVGAMMSVMILGGALSQLPLGHLSDRLDRRAVIAGLLAAGAAFSVLGWLLSDQSTTLLFGAMFFIGAASMPVYALCIATASDNSEIPLIEIASGILIMNSLGSVIGPMTVAPLLGFAGGSAFFLYTAICFTLGALWALYRVVVAERPTSTAHVPILPKTTPVVAELSAELATATVATDADEPLPDEALER